MTKPTFWLVLATGLLLGADQPRRGSARTDRARLQGAWKVTSGKANGKEGPEDAFKEARLEFKGRHVTATTDNGKTRRLAFKIDPRRRPKTIDLTNPDKKQTLLGIYLLKGDRLKLCFGAPGAARPTGFDAKEGTKTVLFFLKRIPADKSGTKN
jgi:uncharacterized protein (TIGR03067 family)